MPYVLQALLIVLISVIAPLAVAGLLGKYQRSHIAVGFGVFVSIVYYFALLWIHWGMAMGVYGPAPFAPQLIIGFVLAGIIAGSAGASGGYDDDFNARCLFGFIPAICVALGALLILTTNSSAFRSGDMAKVINMKKSVEIASALQPADPAHISLVADTMAVVNANQALSAFKVEGGAVAGSRYKIGRPVKQFVAGHLWYIVPVEFQGWLKWNQDKQVPGYLRVSAEDPFAEAQPVQTDAAGDAIHIRYLNSACFEFRADRYLREHGFMGAYLTDYTFEVDDNWRPFYTVSRYTRTIGFSGYQLVSVVTLDLQTGAIKEYPLGSIPSWIDRSVAIHILDDNAKMWGTYHLKGWWYNFWHDDKSMEPTPGWYVTYSTDGDCKLFTGWTSTTKGEHALTGFSVTDMRTNATTFYPAVGVTETVAYRAAHSLWSNFRDYEACELMPYNIYGRLLYVIPMHYHGQFKGVSIVDLQNQTMVAMGHTLEEGLRNFRGMLVQAGSSSIAPASGEMSLMELHGVITRVAAPYTQGNQQMIPFMLKGVKKVFVGVYTYDDPMLPFMSPGDSATIRYLDTKERVITCESVLIPTLPVTDENPVQARAVKARAIASAERNRIVGIEKREEILGSDRMKKVDPRALDAFLKSQSKPDSAHN